MKANNSFAKSLLIICALVVLFDAAAQEPSSGGPKPLFPDDPKGRELPAGVPRMVDTNGNVVWLDHSFTTRQYQEAAFKLVLQEANRVAKELQLPGELPITESNLVEAVVTPFGYNYVNKSIGSITTKKYCYYVSQGNRFSYLEGTHQTEDCYRYQDSYTWPVSRMNTNQAYQLATQWLAAVSMDVKAINRDSQVTVKPDDSYVHSPRGKFVPIYFVSWKRRGYEMSNDVASVIHSGVASVRVFTPTKTLLQLRVEDPKYILRKPLVFTNLDSFFPGTAPVYTLPPPTTISSPGPG
ncbi:MAG: hypothetical protein ABSD57_00160 [Verrucomicrobiota bacterium]|jgi:hypothetical protein